MTHSHGRIASVAMTRRRDLWLLVGGMGLSAVGTNVTFIALPLQLRDEGPYVISMVMMAVLIPVALGASIAGRLVDRFPNRRLMVYAQLGAAGAIAAMVFALDTLPVLLVLLLVLGSASTLSNPAMSALLPKLTGEDGATRGYAALSTARSAGSLVGFGLGALLSAGPGIKVALVLDALTFLVLAIALTAVRAERDPRREATGATRDSARAGLRPLADDRVLLIAVVGLTFAVMVAVLVNVADVFFVFDVLRAGGLTYGLIATAWGAGMVAGAHLAGRLDTDRELALGLFTCGIAMGAVLLAPAVMPTVAVTLVAWLIGGACNAVQTVAIQGLVRSRVPDGLRGRAFAAMNAFLVTANVVGTFAAGPATMAWGPKAVFVIAGVGTMLSAGTAMILIVPHLRGATGRASTSQEAGPAAVRHAETVGASVVRSPGVGNVLPKDAAARARGRLTGRPATQE